MSPGMLRRDISRRLLLFFLLLAGCHNVGVSYNNGPRCLSVHPYVCLSVCVSHVNIPETKRNRRMVTKKPE